MLHRITLLFSLLLCAGHVHAMTDAQELALKQPGNAPQATPPALPANAPSYSGSNVAGPEWSRPFADGTCCSGLGPVTYHTQLFHLSSNDSCDINSTQDGWDGYLFIYADPFDATNQTLNFVAGDDDGNGGIGTSDIAGLALSSGVTYAAVTTGFANGDEGSFTNTISCPTATVTLGAAVNVYQPRPEVIPASNVAGLGMLLAVLGFSALIALRGNRG